MRRSLVGRTPRSHSATSKQRLAKPQSPCLHNSDHRVPQARVPSERAIDLNSSSSKASSSYKEEILLNVRSRNVSGKQSAASTSQSSSGSLSGSKASALPKNPELSQLFSSGVTHSNIDGKDRTTPVKKKLKRNVSETIRETAPSIVCPAKYRASPPIKPHKVEKPLSFPVYARWPCTDSVEYSRIVKPNLNVDVISSAVVHIAILRLVYLVSRLYIEAWDLGVAFTCLAVLLWTATKATSGKVLQDSSISLTLGRKTTSEALPVPKQPLARPHTSTIYKSKRSTKELMDASPNDIREPMKINPATEFVPATFCLSDRTSINVPVMPSTTPGSPEQQGSRGSSPTSSKPSKIPIREQSAEKLKLFERIKSSASDKVNALPEPVPLRSSMEKLQLAPEPFMDKQESSTEKLKQQFCRDTAMIYSNNGRCPNNYAGMKSFKPQLEDIKSSYLLIQNKKKIDSLQTAIMSTEKEKMQKPCVKSPVIDETQRKKMLYTTMKKFQSREFKSDARFNKIEGLNWISWKNIA